jgi:hypothetical protein
MALKEDVAHATVATMPQAELHQEASPLFSIAAAAFLGFGTTLLIISIAYVRDLATLMRVPEAVWLFVCGVPTSDPATMPIMITMSVVAMVIGGGLVWFSRKKRTAEK